MPVVGSRALACGDFLIRQACRRLPESARERELEWAGELPAILADPALRLAWMRVAKMLMFAGGVAKIALGAQLKMLSKRVMQRWAKARYGAEDLAETIIESRAVAMVIRLSTASVAFRPLSGLGALVVTVRVSVVGEAAGVPARTSSRSDVAAHVNWTSIGLAAAGIMIGATIVALAVRQFLRSFRRRLGRAR